MNKKREMELRRSYLAAFSIIAFSILSGFHAHSNFVEQKSHYSFIRKDNTNGLVNNQTTCIFKDSRGFVWIGTSAGLSRYDGTHFKNFIHDEEDGNSLIDNYIINIQEDANGVLWIEMRWEYILYDVEKESFLDISHILGEIVENKTVDRIYIDEHKKIWVLFEGESLFKKFVPETYDLINPWNRDNTSDILDFYHNGKFFYALYANGILECYDDSSYELIFESKWLEGKISAEDLSASLFVDDKLNVWVYGNNNGIYHYKPAANKWTHYTSGSNQIELTSNLINKIIQDKNGNIWIGTDHGGIDIYQPYEEKTISLYHQPENPKSISQNSITDITVDEDGIVWIGTYKNGFCYYHEFIHKFPHVRHLTSESESLPYNDVNCFAEDDKGNLWIGTNGGGLIYYNKETKEYEVYKNDPESINSLSNDVIVSLFFDNEGLLWIGTYTGGLNAFDGEDFVRFTTEGNSNSASGRITSDNVWAISQDEEGDIWIGTLGGGVMLFDKSQNALVPVKNRASISVPSEFVTSIYKMRNGNMMIGTALGIVFYDFKNQQYMNHPYKINQGVLDISNFNVNDVLEDTNGRMWVATREGLTMIDPFTNYIKKFGPNDGLKIDIINCIEEDRAHYIWISKSSGLSQINIIQDQINGTYEFRVHNFSETDGLQAKEFNVNASIKLKNGQLIFGGPNGYNIFDPKEIEYISEPPQIYFTDFQVFNESVAVGEKIGEKEILNQSILSTRSIELKHAMNVFTIEFSVLNYLLSKQVICQYKLEGFDQNWITVETNTKKVTYTNLNPGDYTFKVKASSHNGLWDDEMITLQVSILPPFYRTPLAYTIYVLLGIFILLYYRHTMLKKERLKFDIENERMQARRHQEMDEMKLRFLTNVSHEFRTPLSLILTPLEKLLSTNKSDSEFKLLKTIERNAGELLALVNQLLDFRQLDLHSLRFNPSYGDIVSYLNEVCQIFTESFQKKDIRFEFISNKPSVYFQFDHEKIRKVMMNLLSNALKFTPSQGMVRVEINLIEHGHDEDNEVEIKVSDTGIGIDEKDREKIFERFYQSESNQQMGLSGSGIGLNLAKEMVLLHDGTITVDSTPGNGATFTVVLPVHKEEKHEDTLITKAEEEKAVKDRNTAQTILLVEDNHEFRNFIKESLQENYKIYQADNGRAGLELAHDKHPDLIISDVMMPEMDGLAMCKALKEDLRTSHIPVILLTARTADKDKIKGLEIGAEEYITKPFKMDLLQLRVQKLMEKRRKSHERFQQKVDVSPSEIEISNIDEKLIKKAIKLVESNLSQPKFSVEDLSHELGMSRVHLYKKLMAITGKSPIEFIRIIRLKRAAQLLEKSQMTISEVAYEVGFNSPRYFSKYFEEEFGMLPSAYIKQFEEENKKQ